ncbi:CPBP family intramembrane glutamic endopeptidase [Marinimicrobium sp. ABcell2]|uniref:CPBP family intramembrane glutamic endopeptidase n=1 Tax=Marinimicrobium sp. ABcell2 TaxID=3069751 RepID=UPI0027B0E41D|nr:CPBP family intramembrane glutamic endopeptidase [Marinimicrobium sp. ABcell2]MDQ2076945.1 CPBP family intramembrane glutamic endopeptidase [Marinimicrobium sp. ABcell2]
MLPRLLNPKTILVALDEIDQEHPSYSLSRPAALRRVFVVLASVSVALLALHYLKFDRNLAWLLRAFAEWNDLPENHYILALRQAGWDQLVVYIWWTGWHLICFLLIPWLVIRFMWREKMVDFGWRWAQTRQHWPGYVLLISPILVFIAMVSQGEDFVDHYPFYFYAGRSWFDFLAWQLLYMSQFVALEFFFRGYMVQALRPAMGANAVWVMCVPYLMIHFPKLWLEATGAILFGLFLGILAIRSMSIWGGVLVHIGIALTMDVAALLRKGGLPDQWWPF